MTSTDPPRFLLLLPPAPSPPDAAAFKTAFGITLSDVLKEVASHSSRSPKAAVLEIALACPHLLQHESTPRAALYDQTQSLLAAIYRLICAVAAKENINVEDHDGVDVRVLLVSWAPGSSDDESNKSPHGPIVSLTTLAQSGRPWEFAFGVESESGEAMVRAFMGAKGSGGAVERVQSGPVMNAGSDRLPSNDGKGSALRGHGSNVHHHVAVGGTFDHIHIGHKLLLTMTIFAADTSLRSHSEKMTATIGITGDQLLKNKKHAEVLESWDDRYRSVMTFLDAILDFSPPSAPHQRHISSRNDPGPNGKSIDVTYPNDLIAKCTEIQDPFGPTITEEAISALIISAETRSGGKAVNDKRAEKGWKPLEVFEVDVLDAGEDDGGGGANGKQGFESKLSSTAIREKLAKKRQSSL